MNRNHKLFLGCAALHLVLSVLYNGVSMHHGLSAVYGAAAGPIPHAVEQRLLRALHRFPVAQYALFTGACTGFGFYAPQVGSPYQTVFEAYGTDGQLLHTATEPHLRSGSGILRYGAFLDVFQDASTATDSLTTRYARALVVSLAHNYWRRTRASHVVCKVYRYHPAPLNDSLTTPHWRLIHTYATHP